MELFDSEEDKAVERRLDAELAEQSVADQDGQSLLRVILMALAAIILVFLLVIFARFLYHKAHEPAKVETSNTKKLPTESSGAANKQSGANSANNQTSNKNPSSSTNQNTSLPNGGAGDVLAIFAASSAAAGGLHYIISLRRFNKSGV